MSQPQRSIPVGLWAEYVFFLQKELTGANSNTDDHGQLRRNNGGDDGDAADEQFWLGAVGVLQAVEQNVARKHDREEQKDHDQDEPVGVL